jgi:hypothetical protein
VAQKTTRLRDPESERVRDCRGVTPSTIRNHRIRGSVAVNALVAQERYEVTGCGEAGA